MAPVRFTSYVFWASLQLPLCRTLMSERIRISCHPERQRNWSHRATSETARSGSATRHRSCCYAFYFPARSLWSDLEHSCHRGFFSSICNQTLERHCNIGTYLKLFFFSHAHHGATSDRLWYQRGRRVCLLQPYTGVLPYDEFTSAVPRALRTSEIVDPLHGGRVTAVLLSRGREFVFFSCHQFDCVSAFATRHWSSAALRA